MDSFGRVLVGVGAFVGFLIGLAFLVMFTFGVGVFAENLKAKYNQATLRPKITQTVYQPDNALAIYKKFRDDCRSVVALTQQIDNLQVRYDAAVANSGGSDPLGSKAQAVADALNDLTGAKNQRANVAEQYNANAANFSQAVFKNLGERNGDPELPYRIEAPYTQVNCG